MIRRRVVRPKLVSNGHLSGSSISRRSILSRLIPMITQVLIALSQRRRAGVCVEMKLLVIGSKQVSALALDGVAFEASHNAALRQLFQELIANVQPPFQMRLNRLRSDSGYVLRYRDRSAHGV